MLLFILENDPASNTLKKFTFAYPGFYAIAIYRLSHELYLLDLMLFFEISRANMHIALQVMDIHVELPLLHLSLSIMRQGIVIAKQPL